MIVPPSQLVKKINELIEESKNNYMKNPSSQTKAELTLIFFRNNLVAAQRIIREDIGSSSSKPKRHIITKMSPKKPKSPQSCHHHREKGQNLLRS